MPLETPLTPESIDFEVEGSADRQHSVIVFTEAAKTTADAAAAVSAKPLKQLTKASAPDPDLTSRRTATATSPAASSSSSRSISPSAPTSFISSTTFPTVTATTPSAGLSQSHIRSRQPSAAAALNLAPHVRNPRVDAVLRRGGPASRGRHSISPMAPDAARAPPVELQGPPRYLKERGLTPSPRATAASSRNRSAREAGADKRASPRSNSHTPSPRAVSHRDGEKQRKKERGSRKRTDKGVSSPSHSHLSPHREHTHKHHRRRSNSVSSATTHDKKKRESRERGEKAGGRGGGVADVVAMKEARLRGRGSVVAPPYTAEDTASMDGVVGPSSLLAPGLTVEHLEEQKRRLQRQRQQQLEWDVRNELSSVSFQSFQSRPLGGNGRFAVTDVRAPPPRATSPSHRSQLGRVDAGAASLPPGETCREDAPDVDLTVPVLSAHRDTRSGRPRSITRGGEKDYTSSDIDPKLSGPPGPAAWMPSQRGGAGSAAVFAATAASAAHRYERCDSDTANREGDAAAGGGDGVRNAEKNGSSGRPGGATRQSGVSPRRVRASLPADRPSPTAAAGASLSHRFGVSPTASITAATAAAAARPPRFSASPHLAGTSPIAHSYVAQSFNSYLPGGSTVLGDGANVNGKRTSSGAGVEVAVLAARVAELPPPDVLEHYDHLLRRYRQQERSTMASDVMHPDDSAEVRSLFSVVVHLSLPPQATARRRQQQDVEDDEASAAQVTIGNVKDEVALRTGIASGEQTIVYEAMALQDSLPVHLLLSADDLEGGEDGHSLQLLCVPLVAAPAEARRAVPSSRRTSAATTTATPLKSRRRGDAGGGGGVATAADSEDSQRSLLLLSPSRYAAAPSAAISAAAAPPPLLNGEQRRRGSDADAAPVRLGAVPFTFSPATVERRAAESGQRISSRDDGVQRTAVAGDEERAISQHIDRLRRLYLQDHGSSGADRPTSTGSNHNGFTALPNPRDYLLEPSFEINRTGIVEHANPHVHNLQQQLLLSQLTAAGPSSAAAQTRVPASESAWQVARSRARDAQGTAATGVSARSHTGSVLSDALLAALPAPPVRNAHYSNGSSSGVVLSGGGMKHNAPSRSAPHPMQTPASSTAAAAQRFATNPRSFSSSTPTAAAGAAAHISVLRHTPPSSAFTSGRTAAAANAVAGGGGGGGRAGWSDSDAAEWEDGGGGGGVGASWLASSSQASVTSGDAAAEEEDGGTSYTPNTLDY